MQGVHTCINNQLIEGGECLRRSEKNLRFAWRPIMFQRLCWLAKECWKERKKNSFLWHRTRMRKVMHVPEYLRDANVKCINKKICLSDDDRIRCLYRLKDGALRKRHDSLDPQWLVQISFSPLFCGFPDQIYSKFFFCLHRKKRSGHHSELRWCGGPQTISIVWSQLSSTWSYLFSPDMI